MKRLPLVCFLILLAGLARAQSTDEVMAGLKKQGEEFAAVSAMSSTTPSMQGLASEYREFANNYGSLESYVASGNYEEAIRTLRRWSGRTKNEQVKKALGTLLASLEKEQEKRQEKLAADLDALTKAAKEQLAVAKSPVDVMKIREGFEVFRDYDLNNSGRSTRWLQEQVNRAVNFLEIWQRVLVSEKNGELTEAMQNLRNLRQGSNAESELWDEKILSAKMDALLAQLVERKTKPDPDSPIRKAVIATMEKVKTPEDATEAIRVLRRISQVGIGEESQLTNESQNSLEQYVRMNRDFESGAYARVISNNSSDQDPAYATQVETLKNDLRAKAAAAANDLVGLGAPKPGEGFGTFIRRSAADAYAKKDWPQLFALLSVYSAATGGGCSRTQGMQEGVRAYIAGQQLEQAGQFGDAVASYTLCIAQIGPFVPKAEATEALQRLRKDHPDAVRPTGSLPRAGE